MNIEQNRLLEIFFDLVKIDATSKQERPVAEYICRFLTKNNYRYIIDNAGEIVKGNSGNVIGQIAVNGNTPQLALVAHMDTIKSTAGISPQIHNSR